MHAMTGDSLQTQTVPQQISELGQTGIVPRSAAHG
jgi:hypothetical protein